MTHSMTGYGEASTQRSGLAVEARLRSVNHRYLDLVLRLPDELRPHEGKIREVARQQLARGRVEMTVDLDRLDPPPAELVLDRTVLRAFSEAVEELRDEVGLHGQWTPGDLLRLPEAVRVRRGKSELSQDELEVVLGVAEEALKNLRSARAAEGRRIRALLEGRLETLREFEAEMRLGAPEARTALEEGFRKRLDDLRGQPGLPEERIAQELAILVDKADVSEELDRLHTHLEAFGETLADGTAPVGKRLDFLTQEIHRELNTLAAKCRNSSMLGSVMEGKLVCEQLREQVQNLE